MRFELQPAYPDLPGNDRKALHVDAQAFALIHRAMAHRPPEEIDAALDAVLPQAVLDELKRPMYQGPPLVCGMTVKLDL